MNVKPSPEAEEMLEKAKQQIKGMKGQHFKVTHTEALDWLLKDLCEYGSPIVSSWARSCWPESIETQEWERKNTWEGIRRR